MFPDSNIQPIKWIAKNWVSLILHRSISWQQARSFPPRSRDSGSRVQKNVRCIRGYYVEKNGRIGSTGSEGGRKSGERRFRWRWGYCNPDKEGRLFLKVSMVGRGKREKTFDGGRISLRPGISIFVENETKRRNRI